MAERLELRTRVAALMVLVVIFAAMGCVMIWADGHSHHRTAAVSVVGVLLIAAPIVLSVLSLRRRLVIDERRIVAKGFFSTTVIPWDEVDHYRYWSQGQQGMYVGGGGAAGVLIVMVAFAVAKAINKSAGNRKFSLGGMKLVGRDGKAIKLDLRYKQVDAALDRCFDELHGRLRDRPRDYAPLGVSAAEVTHEKKGALALADIEKVNVSGGRISIKKRGKRLAWAAVSMRSMKNAMLFVDDLAERGIIIDAQSEVFVPVPVLAKLRAAASRQAAFPQAKIVQR